MYPHASTLGNTTTLCPKEECGSARHVHPFRRTYRMPLRPLACLPYESRERGLLGITQIAGV